MFPYPLPNNTFIKKENSILKTRKWFLKELQFLYDLFLKYLENKVKYLLFIKN